MLDIQSIRADFPILQRQVHDKPLVYLDNAATSQKPEAVIQAMDDYYRRYNANIHRGVHTLAEEATAAYEDARRKVGRFINARSPREVVFVRNTTEAINLVAYSWGRANVRPGDVIILTEMEHHSNLVPWQLLAQATGARLRVRRPGSPGPAAPRPTWTACWPRTASGSSSWASPACPTSWAPSTPSPTIARRVHAAGALLLVDGAQSVPHLPVDVRDLDADFLAFSGHKMLGPTGIGVLWARRAILEAMPPFLGGGDMIKSVDLRASEWAELPHKFEAGTPNIAHAIGLAAAVDYLTALGHGPGPRPRAGAGRLRPRPPGRRARPAHLRPAGRRAGRRGQL